MDGFKDAVQKLEQLRDGGFIAPEEFEKSKKELVDSYVLVQAASKPAQQAVTVPSGPAFIVKLRGIPFNTSDSDIINFFFGFALDKQEPVKFQLTPEGKQSGICFVKFSSLQEANRALTKNKQYMGQRYVEVFPSSADEMALRTAPLTATNWVRMRGLPFSATKGDILAFFAGFNLTEAGIFMVSGADGRASGEAFVQFGDEFEAQRALLKDKEPIGQRTSRRVAKSRRPRLLLWRTSSCSLRRRHRMILRLLATFSNIGNRSCRTAWLRSSLRFWLPCHPQKRWLKEHLARQGGKPVTTKIWCRRTWLKRS